MKFSDRLNKEMHFLFAWRLRTHYRKQLKMWEKQHPESFGEVSSELKKKYIDL